MISRSRLSCTVADAPEVAARVRASVPSPAAVADEVAAIVADVRARGDAAVREYEQRFGGSEPPAAELDPAVRAGLETAIANVRAVAEAGLDDETMVTLPEGQSVRLREVPVRRALHGVRPDPPILAANQRRMHGHPPIGRAPK